MTEERIGSHRALGSVDIPDKALVIGASTGGLEALRSIVGELPARTSAAVFIVLHVGSHKSDLPRLLSHQSRLPAVHPCSGESVEAGKIYVAPPDHHMMVESGRIVLTRGPRENRARPAIDPLFRSVARAYGEAAIGVILTGALNDGTAGLFEIKARGGTTVVQDPGDALCADMPQSALTHVEIDHVAPASSLGGLIADLLTRQPVPSRPIPSPEEQEMTTEFKLDRPRAITCPDCGGALTQSQAGQLTRFTCHIGHAYTAEVMLAAQFVVMEQFIETALRALNERAELCQFMAVKADGMQQSGWRAAHEQALSRTGVLKQLLESEWLQPSAAIPRADS